MLLIPPGEFLMGSKKEEWTHFMQEAKRVGDWKDEKQYPNEHPQHRVRLSEPFYLGKYEVTQSQWEAVMGENPASFKGGETSRPIESVTREMVQTFLAKLNERSPRGMKFDLPTEAQWEFACRAGTTTPWYFGDDPAELEKYAWYVENANQRTQPVGLKLPNAFGLYDMLGNVNEMCRDFYNELYYEVSPAVDPAGPEEGDARVVRGGSWRHAPRICRCAKRRYELLHKRPFNLGLRLAVTIDTSKFSPADSLSAKAQATILPADGWVDLLDTFDLDSDAEHPGWQRDERGILRAEGGGSSLRVPVEIFGNYEVRFDIIREDKAESGQGIVLPVGQAPTNILATFFAFGDYHGLSRISGLNVHKSDNPTRHEMAREPGRQYECRISVQTGPGSEVKITCHLDGKEIYSFSGVRRELNETGPDWLRNCIALRSGAIAGARWTSLELRMLSGQAKLLRDGHAAKHN